MYMYIYIYYMLITAISKLFLKIVPLQYSIASFSKRKKLKRRKNPHFQTFFLQHPKY